MKTQDEYVCPHCGVRNDERKLTIREVFDEIEAVAMKGTVMNDKNTDVFEYVIDAKKYNNLKKKFGRTFPEGKERQFLPKQKSGVDEKK